MESLGLLPDHTLHPPTLYQRAGWYAGGVRPGAVGPAIIAGHVDSYQGPAIFFRLRDIKLGADVAVRDSLGVVRHFTVTDIQRYPKSAFPTEVVYGPTPLPVLRLITCTGDFDASKRSYVDNLVVSARLNAPRAG
ncbi:MAG: class F sortase [Jatrophihabitans sp.]